MDYSADLTESTELPPPLPEPAAAAEETAEE